MKFIARAALFAAVTFGAGAFANAATLDLETAPADLLLEQLNEPAPQAVPAQAQIVAPVQMAKQAEIVQPLTKTQPASYTTLSDAVAAQDMPAGADSELHCLAVGVYYESKGEPLAGQLAVAEVIINRTTSGRFPRTVCSVIKQRGQFSFVRGGQLPTPPANAQWRKALAVAQVAQKDLWDSPVGEALYFHARYVNPGWKRPRVGTVGNHIFYR